MSPARLVALSLCLVATPRLIRADAGELAAGTLVGFAWPVEGAVGLGLRFGLGDAWALDLRGGGGLNRDRGLGQGSLGLVWLVDFWTWVPEVRVAAGGRFAGELAPVLELTGGARVFFARAWSAALEAGGRWSPGEGAALVQLVLWRSFD